MRKKALKKEFHMEIKKSLNRFLSIFFIVAMGVAFFSGIQASAPDMRATGDYYFDTSRLMDIKLLGTLGITEDDLEVLSQVEGVESVTGGYMEDVYCGEGDAQQVLHVESLQAGMNEVTAAQGSLPAKADECFLDTLYAEREGYKVGDTLELMVSDEETTGLVRTSFTISGIGYSPNYVALERGSTTLGSGSVAGFVYLLPEAFDAEVYSVAYLHVAGAREEMAYTDGYNDLVDAVFKQVEGLEDVRCEVRYDEIMSEAQEKIDDAKQEVEDGKQELADAKQELEDGQREAESELAEAESELIEGESELEDGKKKLEDSRKELEDGEQELAEGESEIAANETTLSDARAQIASARETLSAGEAEYQSGLAEYRKQSESASQQMSSAQEEIDSGRKQLADGWKQYEEESKKLADGEKQLSDAEKQLTEAQAAYDDGVKQLAAAKQEYESGAAQAAAGRTQYEEQAAQLATAKEQYETGSQALADGRKQYEAGLAQYQEGKAAYDAGFSQYQEAENTWQASQDTLTSQRAAYNQAVAEVQAKKAELGQARAGVAQLWQAQSDALAAQTDALARRDALDGPIAEKQAAVEGKTAEAAAAQAAYEAAAANPDSSEEQVAAAKAEADARRAEADSLAQELAGLTAQREQAAAEAAEAGGRAEAAAAQAQALEQTVAQAETEIGAAEAALAAQGPQLEAYEAELAAARTELDSQLGVIRKTKEQLDASEKQLNEAKAELDSQDAVLAAAKEQLDSGLSQLAAAKEQLDATDQQLAGAKAILDEKDAEMAKASEELTEGWKELRTQKATLKSGKKQLTSAKKELEANEKKLDDAQKELDSGKKELAEAKNQLTAARSELDQGWAQLNASQSQLADGESQLSDARGQLSEARQKLADGRKEIADAEKEIEENEQKIKDGWADYEEGKKEAEDKIAEGEQKIADAEEELRDAEQKIADAEQELADIKFPKWYVYDRSELPDNAGFGENAERMTNIAQVFPAIFFLVAALISLTTMTRMVEEERTQIGTMKALGYGKKDIASKYLKYAFYATLGGSVVGVLFGEKVFPWVIVTAYGILYQYMPKILLPYDWKFGAMATAAALACTLIATFSACARELQPVPAQLMRPPAPKEGKRVFLEFVPFVWRRLSFTWKSTVRNLLRYKKRFLMTVIGIGGCMGLLLVGYGLRDSIMDVAILQFEELQLYDAMTVLDMDAPEQERQVVVDSLEADDRILAQKRFAMYKEQVKGTDGSRKEWTLYLYVPEDLEGMEDFLCFRERTDHDMQYTLTDEGAIVTEKIAKEFGVKAGDTLTLESADKTVRIPVAAVCENYLSHYIYLTPELYRTVYQEEPEYNSVFFRTQDGLEEAEGIGTGLLRLDCVLNVTYTKSMKAQLDNMLGALDIVMIVLIVSAGMLAFVVLYNLNNININERKRELATIKVLGFYDSEVAAYVYRENILLTLIGAAAGIFIGKYLHMFIITTVEVDACMFGRTIKTGSYIIGTLFTFGFSILVNFVMYYKLKKIDMVESLKSVE